MVETWEDTAKRKKRPRERPLTAVKCAPSFSTLPHLSHLPFPSLRSRPGLSTSATLCPLWMPLMWNLITFTASRIFRIMSTLPSSVSADFISRLFAIRPSPSLSPSCSESSPRVSNRLSANGFFQNQLPTSKDVGEAIFRVLYLYFFSLVCNAIWHSWQQHSCEYCSFRFFYIY